MSEYPSCKVWREQYVALLEKYLPNDPDFIPGCGRWHEVGP